MPARYFCAAWPKAGCVARQEEALFRKNLRDDQCAAARASAVYGAAVHAESISCREGFADVVNPLGASRRIVPVCSMVLHADTADHKVGAQCSGSCAVMSSAALWSLEPDR